MSIKRNIIKYPTTHEHFVILNYGEKDSKNQPTVPVGADFAIKAYGSNCGTIESNIINLRPKSWHFIKSNGIISVEELKNRFSTLDYEMSKDSCRQDSLGKMELIYLYNLSFHS